MAYTAVVTKQLVNKISDTMYNATIQMTVNDGTEDVLIINASARYNSNAADLAAVKADLLQQLKDKWDKWAAENQVFSNATFDTMVSEIQTAANTYINQE